MADGIARDVTVGVATAVVLGGLTLLSNFFTSGGLVRALGGVTQDQLQQRLEIEVAPLQATLQSADSDLAALRSNVSALQASLQSLDTGLGDLREDVRPAIELAPRIDQQLNGLVIPSPIPDEAVVAFALPDPGIPGADPCPAGWARYDLANGRFLVAAGTHRAGLAELKAFDRAGERDHTLTLPEMPAHAHRTVEAGDERSLWGVGSAIAARHGDRWDSSFATSLTEPVGGDEPHNNMPPYIALYFCKKGAG